jgi:hypothetical protein
LPFAGSASALAVERLSLDNISMRTLLGIIALLLLVIGIATKGHADEAFWGGCVRMGVMLGIWWFAYPQVQHVPRWLAVTGGITILVVALRPKLVFYAIPILIVLWFLRPRTPGRRRAPAD